MRHISHLSLSHTQTHTHTHKNLHHSIAFFQRLTAALDNRGGNQLEAIRDVPHRLLQQGVAQEWAFYFSKESRS